MKILTAIPSLGNGGAEKLVVELSNEFAAQDHEAILLSLKNIEDWMIPPKSLSPNVRLIQFGKKKGFQISLIFKIFTLLRREKPDVVHIHLNAALFYFIPLILLFKRIRFYFTIHSTFEIHESFIERINIIPWTRRISYICLTSSISNRFTNRFENLSFSLIENGVKKTKLSNNYEETKNFVTEQSKKYKFVFLFVGRLSFAKNIPLLITVFSDQTMADSKLIIIGDGDQELKQLVEGAQMITNNRIEYLGAKNNVYDYMVLVDALILVSRYEGLPIVAIEALQVGLPVISTPVGGLPDVIENNQNGFLSQSQSVKNILNAIDKFKTCSSEKLIEISKRNKEKYINQYSIEVCALKHLRLYQLPH